MIAVLPQTGQRHHTPTGKPPQQSVSFVDDTLLVAAFCALTDQPGRQQPLPREIVTDEGVAIGGIIPQPPVKRKRLIELVDLGTGVVDGRGNVNTRRLLRQRQRWGG